VTALVIFCVILSGALGICSGNWLYWKRKANQWERVAAKWEKNSSKFEELFRKEVAR
jgi:uncharacterized iron-regulated membrane protein